jgi:RNA polymerase sigma-70 factor (family 1)
MRNSNSDIFVMRTKSNGEEEFEKIFNDWHASIYYLAYSILGDMQEAEDIVSDSFIYLWEHDGDFNSRASRKCFLYKLARNKCIDIIRHRKVIQANNVKLSIISRDSGSFLDQIIFSELTSQIQSALDDLPPQCRKIFHLIYSEGKKNKEVAKLLKLSINTIKAQRQRGLLLLRKKLLIIIFVLLTHFI